MTIDTITFHFIGELEDSGAYKAEHMEQLTIDHDLDHA